MEEERILERERLQMEQIRELDFEELQVEEVDEFRDSEDDDDDLGISHHTRRLLSDNVGADDEHVFNPDVASLHTYLGGVVLFPESTLPLRIVQSTFLAAIERAFNQPNAPCTIGVIRVYREGNQFKYATLGTTAEIRQYRRLSDGSFNVITRGQQRFLLNRRWTDVEGFPCGEVHIVEEDVPLRTPRDAFGKLVPISNLRAPSHSSTMALSASFRDTDEIKIPVSESIRQELLEIDGVSYRLQREIELLESFDRVRCKHCQSVVARRSDMLVMSSDGPLGAYVNPHGYVHEIMTFYKANDIAISGRSVKEDSWFPGYAWTIANCATCETQLGWLFTATSKKLKPSSFWAVRSSQVADDMR
ncbi:hypothetical protein BRARA_I04412 [Brassica rapa]|uniref:Protein cereblon n=1 Tax=Brassica campestris TaxID=3711 RepID=A0A397YA43_BRACM|nr:hypothetical protein BRARA_I04412 [Brassica rapa]